MSLAVSIRLYVYLQKNCVHSIVFVSHTACQFEECDLNGIKKCIDPNDDRDSDCVKDDEVQMLIEL